MHIVYYCIPICKYKQIFPFSLISFPISIYNHIYNFFATAFALIFLCFVMSIFSITTIIYCIFYCYCNILSLWFFGILLYLYYSRFSIVLVKQQNIIIPIVQFQLILTFFFVTNWNKYYYLEKSVYLEYIFIIILLLSFFCNRWIDT